MRMMIEIRDANEDDDGRNYGFVCEAKAGVVSILRFPPIKDPKGKVMDLSYPMVDFIAEYEGCYTPGQALEVFGRALDTVLAQEAWEARGKIRVEVEVPRYIEALIGSPNRRETVKLADCRAQITIKDNGNEIQIEGAFPQKVWESDEGRMVKFEFSVFHAENDNPVPFIKLGTRSPTGAEVVIPWDLMQKNLQEFVAAFNLT